MIKVKGTAKVFPPDGDKELLILAPLADSLSPEVRAITVDDDGLLTEVSTDPEDDETDFIAYPPISLCGSLADCRTVQHAKLQELDRLGPFIDLVSYEDEAGIPQKVAFKFNVLDKPLRLQMAWDELNILKSLPPHPNMVPFDRVVLDECRVIGFTTKYIPGEILANSKVPFRFQWLQQLTQLMDFLNLEYGIMHQDIALRNLLVDPRTHKILLFDFDRATVGKKNLQEGRDDVSAVAYTLYELITNNTSFSDIPHWERNIDMVQSISEWTSHRELDSEVTKFRNFLNKWVATRRSDVDGDMKRYLNAPNRLTLPDLPIPPEYNVPFQLGTIDGKPRWITGHRFRRTAMKLGQYCFRWERPPQSRLLNKASVE
ncbi:uncharacterized protein N7479_011355 [Penicillium vulpinum]|uniref:EKC/KEOPS complex subunit BUD32 n=1 Tax=Penicillium vulpinum TaxID=29845 RepID=A0A1V6RX22_9EURO|nr:uncharacterized protein N7479_011355 [Penicillium vulpinum]KAJ5952942.1 hypothetical protein N7479_011355 [Penicillium vulpinum]OQE06331.1 hypothetical protein PENVUL_c018G04422 [Penicillium vulpinum]